MFTSTQILIPQLRMMSDNGMLGFLPQEVDMGNIPDAVTKLTGSLVLLWLWEFIFFQMYPEFSWKAQPNIVARNFSPQTSFMKRSLTPAPQFTLSSGIHIPGSDGAPEVLLISQELHSWQILLFCFLNPQHRRTLTSAPLTILLFYSMFGPQRYWFVSKLTSVFWCFNILLNIAKCWSVSYHKLKKSLWLEIP